MNVVVVATHTKECGRCHNHHIVRWPFLEWKAAIVGFGWPGDFADRVIGGVMPVLCVVRVAWCAGLAAGYCRFGAVDECGDAGGHPGHSRAAKRQHSGLER
jgi:hypothetical protein